jgi:ketosteroid isomerase-like protein
MDTQAALDMLSDDIEIFDTVPYRLDGKQQFSELLVGALHGIASMTFGLHQASCRMIGDDAGVVNGYDSFTGITKDGNVVLAHGRTTLVCARQAGQWKIVSAHFSSLPKG